MGHNDSAVYFGIGLTEQIMTQITISYDCIVSCFHIPVWYSGSDEQDYKHMCHCCDRAKNRADYRFVPSQWKTMALIRNEVSHWLGASLESSLVK